MANKADVELVFGVSGGGSLSGASGQQIQQDLEKIVANLLKRKIPKIQLHFDTTKLKKQISDIQKLISDSLSIKLSAPRVSNSTNKSSNFDSGSAANTVKEQAAGYLKLQTEIKKTKDATEKYYKTLNANTALTKQQNNQRNKIADIRTEIKESNISIAQRLSLLRQLNQNQISTTDTLTKQLRTQENAYGKVADKAITYLNGVQPRTQRTKQLVKELNELLQKPILTKEEEKSFTNVQKLDAYKQGVQAINDKLRDTKIAFAQTGEYQETFFTKFKSALGNKFFSAISASLIAFGTNAIRKVYGNVVDLDQAITNLQIATGNTRKETKQLIATYSELAQQLGATITEVTDAADTWLRQGYDIAETNQLITYTMMLSKLGQLNSAEAARALTSAMKGYKKEVSEAMGIVDKFTAVDMEAAIGAGDIATAMAETAASADVAGVSMDKLIGYIATVGEITQDGAESVGTFFKTLFARMGSISAGDFVDAETGEALNDVEKTLDKVGISLRNNDGVFRDFSTVLDEVADKWRTFDNVQQHAIATAFSGTRQQEKFIVLMENYGSALNYATVAAESTGTAADKYQNAYLDNVESRLNQLTATWQSFSKNLLDSDILKTIVDLLNSLAKALDWIIKSTGNAVIVIPTLLLLMTQLPKIIDKIKAKLLSLGNTSQAVGKKIKETLIGIAKDPVSWMTILIGVLQTLDNSTAKAVISIVGILGILAAAIITTCKSADKSIKSFMASNPIGWIILAISLAIEAVKALDDIIMNNSFAKLKDIAKESKEEWKKTADAVKEVGKSLESTTDKLKEYEEIKQKRELTSDEKLDMAKLEQEQSQLATRKKDAEKAEDNAKKKSAEDTLSAITKYNEKKQHTYEDYTTGEKVGRWLAGFYTFGLSELIYSAEENKQESNQDKAKRILENYKSVTEEEKAWLDDYVNQIYSLTDGYEYAVISQAHPALTEAEKQVNELLDMTYDLGEKKAVAENRIGDAWNSVSARLTYKNQIDKLKELAESFKLTDKTMQEFINDPANTSFVEHLKAIGLFGENGALSLEDLTQRVKELGKYNASASPLKSFMSILNSGITDEYDIVKKAIEEMNNSGNIGIDTINDLMNSYKPLWEQLTGNGTISLSEDGYTIQDDGLDNYIQYLIDSQNNKIDSVQAYYDKIKDADQSIYGNEINEAKKALENEIANGETLMQAINALQKADLIEEYKTILENQSDELEKQADKYKDIIDIRKELLDTYKEELDYQNELNKKQQNVAGLQTKLKLAQLDNSASGQANVRKIQKELDDATEELSEYTLEHAIDDLQSQLDDEYNEYNKFISEKVDAITKAIENASKMSTDALRQYLKNNTGETKKYHSGGFVGNIKPLKSSEEFAKLLKGELVVTPVQMSNFMNKTLPNITSQGLSGIVNYNSPLIAVHCDNINKESIPELNRIVNKAVEQVKQAIDSKFSRTGKSLGIDNFKF